MNKIVKQDAESYLEQNPLLPHPFSLSSPNSYASPTPMGYQRAKNCWCKSSLPVLMV